MFLPLRICLSAAILSKLLRMSFVKSFGGGEGTQDDKCRGYLDPDPKVIIEKSLGALYGHQELIFALSRVGLYIGEVTS